MNLVDSKKKYGIVLKEEMYKHYRDNFDRTLDRKQYRRILRKFNQRIFDQMLQGHRFNPACNLGQFYILRVSRNHRKKVVDWGSSEKRYQELINEGYTPKSKENPDGYNWIVFFTDDWYYKPHWRKKHCNIPGQKPYVFSLTFSNKKWLAERAKNSPSMFFNIRHQADDY